MGIDSCRSAGRDIAGGRYVRYEQQLEAGDRHRVGGAGLEKQILHRPRECQRSAGAERDARQREYEALATSRGVSVSCAPSAGRMPTSCVRCTTEYSITP